MPQSDDQPRHCKPTGIADRLTRGLAVNGNSGEPVGKAAADVCPPANKRRRNDGSHDLPR